MPLKQVKPVKVRPPELLRKLITAAMDLERRTMQLYCRFEALFPKPEEVRAFWFDMAQHESRHFGALALVDGLLDSMPQRSLPAAPRLKREHIVDLRDTLTAAENEAVKGISLKRAFEIALSIEGSEIEDLVLDLLAALKGEKEREHAMQLLIHDLADLSYMVEKYAADKDLLAEVDRRVEEQVGRLRGASATARPRQAAVRPVKAKPRRR